MDNKTSLEDLILNEFPYPIAARYQVMLDETSYELKASRCIEIYEAGLRALTLGVMSQYIQRDFDEINDATLNKVALELINTNKAPSLGTWQRIFFSALKAYKGFGHLFFMTELYDFYWNTNVQPHKPRRRIQKPFQRLVELRNEIKHTPPTGVDYWQNKFEEIYTNLYEILQQFQFLVNYDLIHIVNRLENGYSYDTYTGQNIVRGRVFQTKELLNEGWCYLSKTTSQLLPVHPLIIFWENELNQDNLLAANPEVVIFDSYKPPQGLKYWHSSAGARSTDNPDLLDLFITLIVEKLQEQRPQREITRLSWEAIKDLSSQIAIQRMGDARGKYKPRLYLQREKTRETFTEFLQSEKNILILTGNSGVGKSNFLLSLIDEFHDNEFVNILAYNGARLSPEESLEKVLAHDFNYHLKFRGQYPPDGNAILIMIDALEGIKDHLVLIFVDAINENPEGKELLRSIDRFVENFPYPWIKIVITSRPEAWRTIKHGVSLAEHRYFRQLGEDNLGIEMSGFTYADYEIRVLPFFNEELPLVYEKYRNLYHLKKEYDEISAQIKRLLRDPLTLLLVAETYQDQAIPDDIRANELIEKYIQMLINTERLNQNDLYFLRQEIVPRLFQPPFSPSLVSKDIENDFTADGRPLIELIFNDDPLPGGRRVNQSYINLADSAILIEQSPESEQVIGFKYERFYEHFGGLYLSQTANKAENPFDFYLELGKKLESQPYLWGALKNAFYNDLTQGRTDLIHKLSNQVTSSDRLLRSAIVLSVVEFNEVRSEVVSNLIDDMIQPLSGPANDIFETAKRLLFRKRFDAKNLYPEQAIAIEIAGRLKYETLLAQAASDRFGAIRQAAILHIFHLWRNDKEAGYRIMHQLGEYAIASWDLPDLGTIEALTSLITSIITYDHLNSEVQAQILQAGRRLLRKLLLLDEKEKPTILSKFRYLVWGQIRRPLLTLGINWGLRIISSWGDEDLPANPKTLSNFFTLSQQQKELLKPLIPYIDPKKSGLINQVDEIIACEETGDFLSISLAGAPIITRARTNFEDCLGTLRELVNRRLENYPPKPWFEAYLWFSLQIALRQTTPHPELFELGERCILVIQNDPELWLKHHKELAGVSWGVLTQGVVSYMQLHYMYKGTAISTALKNWIERAIKDEDTKYLHSFVNAEMRGAFEMGFQQVALQGLQLLADYPDKILQQSIAELLIRLRHYFPTEVENILLQEVFPEHINQQVWSSSISEKVNDLLGLRAIGILYDLFFLGPDLLRQEAIWVARQAMKVPNLESLVKIIIQEMLNLAVNEVIFPVQSDSPSKLYLEQL